MKINMKSAKDIITETILKLQAKHKTHHHYQSFESNDTSLSPLDLMYNFSDFSPIHFTGMIEDYLFRQSRQIFDLLKQDTDQDIEGLTYTEIRNDVVKNTYFDRVRKNIPKYYALKLSERQKHFEQEGQLYMKKLGVNPQQISHNNKEQISNKKQAKVFEPTPIKCTVSKKQSLKYKKQQKKHNNNARPKDEIKKCQIQAIEKKDDQQQRFNTPEKKLKEKKKVKFFQFQYVKDFSQYKTPKRLAVAEQLIQPLKDQEPQQKSNQ